VEWFAKLLSTDSHNAMPVIVQRARTLPTPFSPVQSARKFSAHPDARKRATQCQTHTHARTWRNIDAQFKLNTTGFLIANRDVKVALQHTSRSDTTTPKNAHSHSLSAAGL
jgi:hypothetical protein